MSRIHTGAALAVTLFGVAACGQQPAAIDYKGQYTFGPQTARYASAPRSVPRRAQTAATPVYHEAQAITPVDNTTTQTVSTVSIGVTDLSPPSKPVKPAQTAQAEPAPAPAPKQVAQAKPSVNPWTGKPRKIVSADEATKVQPVRLSVDQPNFIWPVNGSKVISGFGPKGGGKANDGINIAAAAGEPVWAAADGEVVYVGNELSGYGNMVIIKHSGGKSTTYAHLSRSNVDKYDRVQQGDILGYVGSTGNVKSPQLHFAMRDGKQAVDPQKFLSTSFAALP